MFGIVVHQEDFTRVAFPTATGGTIFYQLRMGHSRSFRKLPKTGKGVHKKQKEKKVLGFNGSLLQPEHDGQKRNQQRTGEIVGIVSWGYNLHRRPHT